LRFDRFTDGSPLIISSDSVIGAGEAKLTCICKLAAVPRANSPDVPWRIFGNAFCGITRAWLRQWPRAQQVFSHAPKYLRRHAIDRTGKLGIPLRSRQLWLQL